MKNSTHKQTAFIIQGENGEMSVFQYAPTMSYAGRRDSDQYSLMLGVFIKNPGHDMEGSITCYKNTHSFGGINTSSDYPCKIIAKRSFDWDMSKPMGQRESNVLETENFKELLQLIRNKK